MDSKFSSDIAVSHQGSDFVFHKVELDDTVFLVVQVDGAVDTTFEVPLNSKQSINILSDIKMLDEESDWGIEPTLIVGDHNNLKIQIVATQIGKLTLKNMKYPKDVILSIGSKWFGKGNDTDTDDFDKLMFVLSNVKKLYDN